MLYRKGLPAAWAARIRRTIISDPVSATLIEGWKPLPRAPEGGYCLDHEGGRIARFLLIHPGRTVRFGSLRGVKQDFEKREDAAGCYSLADLYGREPYRGGFGEERETMRITTSLVGALAACGLATGALGQVDYYEGSQIVNVQGLATFDDLMNGSPLQNYMEDGLTLDVNDFAFVFTPPGFLPEWGPPYYPNGGIDDLDNITRTDGQNFQALEMNVSHGFAGTTIYVWIQAFLDGGLVDEFDVNIQGGTLVGLKGAFDEVRMGSFADAATRDTHNPLALNAIALDNVIYGQIPAPGAIALLGLAGVVGRHRRRHV